MLGPSKASPSTLEPSNKVDQGVWEGPAGDLLYCEKSGIPQFAHMNKMISYNWKMGNERA